MASDLKRRAQGSVERQQNNGDVSIQTKITDMKNQFAMAMPRGGEAAQLVRDALTVVRQTPKLAECEHTSLLGALMTCAQLGLRPGIGALGHAYILPMYNSKARRMDAQLILGYQGMLELANRSGEIEMVVARQVHENDFFELDYGTDTISHKPAMTGRGKVIGYYAKFYRKGSNRATYEFMSVADAEEHRDKFAMAKTRDGKIVGPWAQHFDAMATKTVVRRLFKWMPRNTTIADALIADDSVRVDMTPTADLTQVAEHTEGEAVEGNVVENSRGIPDGFDPGTGEMPEPPADDPFKNDPAGQAWGGQ